MHGILLFAHGARDPAWATPFHAIAAQLQRQVPAMPVQLAFLELMTPDLAGGAAELVARGCRQVTVVPLFLGSGGHVRQDLPRLLEALTAQHPQVAFGRTPAIGESATVIAAIASATLAMLQEAQGTG